MKTHPHDLTLTPLARGEVLPLPGGRGRAVGVFSGRAWITEEGDLDDHVLGPGESFRLARPGLAVVEALEDTQLILFEEPSADRAEGTTRAPKANDPAGTAIATTMTVADYERLALAMQSRARDEAFRWLGRALVAGASGLWHWLTSHAGSRGPREAQGPAAPPAPKRAPTPMRRRWPGGPAPVWHAPR